MTAAISRLNDAYPATFPVGNDGLDNITTALMLIKLAAVAASTENHISDKEMIQGLAQQLDLVERFLEAGVAWARDVNKYLVEAEHAAAKGQAS